MRQRAKIVIGAILSGAIDLTLGSAAQAQINGRSLANAAEADAVGSRPRLAYDAVGIDLGSFLMYPSAEAKLTYDDNVYDSDVDRRSDANFVFSPKVLIQSQWSRHSLSFTANADIQRYTKLHSENNDQYAVALDGRFDISQAIALGADGSYGRHSEPRGSLGDVIIGGEPSRYDEGVGKLTATVTAGDVLLTANGGVEYYNYLPVLVGDTRVSQDYRDRNVYSASLRADYSVGPGLRLFVTGSDNVQRYTTNFGDIDQNSHGYEILGGVSFGLTELLSGEIGIGYLSQSYAQQSFGTVAGISYNGKLIWNPTTLLTVTLTGDRTLQQSPLFDQSGIIEDSFGATVDYELLRNLVLSLSGKGIFDDYRGIDRHERLYTLDFSGRYLINRMLEADLEFNHRQERATGLLGRQYTGSSVSLGLTVKK